MRLQQAETQSADARPMLVVGNEADWDVAASLAGAASQTLFYSLEGAWRVRGLPVPYDDVVDITGEIQSIEVDSWAWATALSQALCESGGEYSDDVVEIMRRSLFAFVFRPIGAARARAARVRAASADLKSVTVVGMSDIEVLALEECFEEVTTAPVSAAAHPVASPRTSAKPCILRLLCKPWSAVRLIARILRDSLGNARLLGPLRSMRCSRSRPCAIVMLKNEQHVRVLASTIRELRSRGWRLVLLVTHEGVSLSEESLESFDMQADISRLANPESLSAAVRFRSPNRELREDAIRDWCSSNGFGLFGATITRSATRLRLSGDRYLVKIGMVVRALRPQAVLTINETHMSIEAATVAGRRLEIPTINVQHGIISPTPLRSDFRFDAFCVFGEKYAETLESLGTSRERIRVVGNPLLDLRNPQAEHGQHRMSQAGNRTNNSREHTMILYAAQHYHPNLSDLVLYASLSVVLMYAEQNPDCEVVLKLHPMGQGKELGYELALAEHPNAAVDVVRDGSLHDMIEAADCVATYSSTVVFDAAAVSRPTVFVAPFGMSDWRTSLVAEGTAAAAADAEEFAECVRMIRSGEGISDEALQHLNQQYSLTNDGRAGVRIADICEELAHR